MVTISAYLLHEMSGRDFKAAVLIDESHGGSFLFKLFTREPAAAAHTGSVQLHAFTILIAAPGREMSSLSKVS
jgi:hypothetical protein